MGRSISAFVGGNGDGKSLAAVELFALPAWRRGVSVVSNMRLYPERVGFDAGLYRPLKSWRDIGRLGRHVDPETGEALLDDDGQLVSLTDNQPCRLLLDEISAALPSRQAMSVPPQLVRVLNQMRKLSVQVAWTAPNWARADVLLREVTQTVTVCQGRWPDGWVREPVAGWWPRISRSDDGARVPIEDREWLPNRLFSWVTFDAMAFDEFTYAAVRDVKPLGKRWYYRQRHQAQFAYDTSEHVDLLDHLDDIGVCVGCGGNRTRPKCSCERPAPAAAVGPGRRAAPKGPEADNEGVIELDRRAPAGPVGRGRKTAVRVSR